MLDRMLEQVDDSVAAARAATKAPPPAAPAGQLPAAASGGAGVASLPAAVAAAATKGGGKGSKGGGFTSYMDAAAQAAPRPQEAFEDAVDNSRAPFKPKLDSLAGVVDVEAAAAAAAAAADAGQPAPHPLAARLEALAYPAWQLEVGEAQPPRSDEETPFTYIDTVPALRAAGACVRPGGRRRAVVEAQAGAGQAAGGLGYCAAELQSGTAPAQRACCPTAALTSPHLTPTSPHLTVPPCTQPSGWRRPRRLLWTWRRTRTAPSRWVPGWVGGWGRVQGGNHAGFLPGCLRRG